MDADETTEPIEHEVEFFNIMEVGVHVMQHVVSDRYDSFSFSLIFQMFGNSFLRPDIILFKQNLCYLETLNTKHKLYSKVHL